MNDLYLLLFRFNGIPYALTGTCANRESMLIHARRIAERRNADIPTERSEVVNIYQIGKDITQQRAEEWKAELTAHRTKMGFPNPEDIDAENPIRILHSPVTQNLLNGGWAAFGKLAF